MEDGSPARCGHNIHAIRVGSIRVGWKFEGPRSPRCGMVGPELGLAGLHLHQQLLRLKYHMQEKFQLALSAEMSVRPNFSLKDKNGVLVALVYGVVVLLVRGILPPGRRSALVEALAG